LVSRSLGLKSMDKGMDRINMLGIKSEGVRLTFNF